LLTVEVRVRGLDGVRVVAEGVGPVRVRGRGDCDI